MWVYHDLFFATLIQINVSWSWSGSGPGQMIRIQPDFKTSILSFQIDDFETSKYFILITQKLLFF